MAKKMNELSSSDDAVPGWLHQFQLVLMERLGGIETSQAVLEAGQREIVRRLDLQNGAIARHEQRFNEAQAEWTRVQSYMQEHGPDTCGIGEQVGKLSRQIEANRVEREAGLAAVRSDLLLERKTSAAVARERAKWHRALHPGYVVAFILFVILVIGNGELILKGLAAIGIKVG